MKRIDFTHSNDLMRKNVPDVVILLAHDLGTTGRAMDSQLTLKRRMGEPADMATEIRKVFQFDFLVGFVKLERQGIYK